MMIQLMFMMCVAADFYCCCVIYKIPTLGNCRSRDVTKIEGIDVEIGVEV